MGRINMHRLGWGRGGGRGKRGKRNEWRVIDILRERQREADRQTLSLLIPNFQSVW